MAMGEPWTACELENGHMVAMGELWDAWELGSVENEQ